MGNPVDFSYKKINDKVYKYEVKNTFATSIQLKPSQDLHNEYFSLFTSGLLTIKKGYRWDGASGPTIDTKSVIYASLIHDILYQMLRENQLNRLTWKDKADRELQRIMIECGDNNWELLNKFRAGYYYNAVKYFGHRASGGKITDIFRMNDFEKAS